jgi:hypothetical protein
VTLRECARAHELSVALRAGGWPAGCDAGLRKHVEHCESCRETALVAQLLRDDRADAIREMPLASPGLLWWRAQILQRQAAVRRASRPVHVAITVSLLTSLVVAVSVFFGLRSQIASWISSVVAVPISAQPGSSSFPAAIALPFLLVLFALTALATIFGVAVYAAVHHE